MMKKLIGFIIIITFGCMFTGCGEKKFDGSITSSNTELVMDFDCLDDAKTHEIDVEGGQAINVDIKSLSGEISLKVVDSEGNAVYQGVNIPTSNFTIEISNSDKYMVTVEGDDAKGDISIKVPKDE